MDLPTYTNIWRIEKRLYKLYDLRLPMPLPLVQIGVFLGVFVPWIVLLRLVGIPFESPWHVLYIVPPGVLTWLATRPVIEGKRLTELLLSHSRYLAEPRTWCRLTPIREPREVVIVARVWRRPAAPAPAPEHVAVKPRPDTARAPEVPAPAAPAPEVPAPRPEAPPATPRLENAPGSGKRGIVSGVRRPGTYGFATTMAPGKDDRKVASAQASGAEPGDKKVAGTPRTPPPPATRPDIPMVPGAFGSPEPLVNEAQPRHPAEPPRSTGAPGRPPQDRRPTPERPDEPTPQAGRVADGHEAGRTAVPPEAEQPAAAGSQAQASAHEAAPAGREAAPEQPGRPAPQPPQARRPAPERPVEAPPTGAGEAPAVPPQEPPPTRRSAPGRPVERAAASQEEVQAPQPGARPVEVVPPEGARAAAAPQEPSGRGVVPGRPVERAAAEAGRPEVQASPSGAGEAGRSEVGPPAAAPQEPPRVRPGESTLFEKRVPAPGERDNAGESPRPAEPQRPQRGASEPAPAGAGHEVAPHRTEGPPQVRAAGAGEPGRAAQPAAPAAGAPQAPAPRAFGSQGTPPAPGHRVPGASQPGGVPGQGRPTGPDGPDGPEPTADGPRLEAPRPWSKGLSNPVRPAATDAQTWPPVPEPGAPQEVPPQEVPPRDVRSGPQSPVRPRPLPPPPAPPPSGPAITPPGPEHEVSGGGLRRLFQAVGGGHGDVDAEYELRLQQPFQGTRHVVVLGCTGGAGQTVTALMLGHTFAQHNGEPVVAIDVNPGPGALARRTRSETNETLTGLITRADQVGSLTAMRRYTSQAKSGLDVVAAGKNPLQALDDRDYALAIRTIDRFYSVTLLDTAAAVVARVLPYADQVVLVAPASADAPRAVAMTYEWLDGHGYEDLRSRAVTVINGVSRRSMDDVEQAEAVARGRCRALVRIPWDDHLSMDRAPRNELKSLRAPTRRAYLALAGVVAGGFGVVPERYQEFQQEQEATR